MDAVFDCKLPLVEVLSTYNEDIEIQNLCSSDPKQRTSAAEILKTNGTEATAAKLDGLILDGGLSRKIKRDAGAVLISLSWKEVDALANSSDRRMKRMQALAVAFRPRYI